MKKAIYLILTIPILTGCQTRKDKIPAIDPEFTNYISGFTSGVISVSSSLTIQFVNDISRTVREDSTNRSLIDCKPSIKGSYKWLNSRTLEFRPDGFLESGTLYQCRFYLDRVMEVPDKLKVLEFQFQTIKQSINVEVRGLNSLDDEDLKWQQLNGTLESADYSNPEKTEEILTARQDGKYLKISWKHDETGTRHDFVVDSISRSKEKKQVQIQWDGKGIKSGEKGEKLVDIPPLGEFKLMQTMVRQQPDQFVNLFFSDPVNKRQDLNGLIYFETGEDIQLEVEGSQVKVYPSVRLQGNKTIIVSDALRNSLDYNLLETYKNEVTFTSINPDVELVGDGVIIPASDGLVFPFKAVNLKAVNVRIIKIFENNIGQFLQENQFDGSNELRRVGRIILKKEIPLVSDKPIDLGNWNLFSLDLADLFKSEPGAIYNVSITFDRSQSLMPCISEDQKDPMPYKPDNETERFNAPPTGNYYWDYGYDEQYNWNEREDPCSNSYYVYKKQRNEASRNVLASDLGIIAKSGTGTDLLIAITSLTTTDPISGVRVEIYNYQNQLIAVRETDQKGMASVNLENKPFLLIAKYGEQRGYLRLDDGSALSTSMFDVGGSRNSRGIKGFMYGERSVWRPGDSIYMTFVLEDKNKVLPANHPVRFELYTPEDQLYLTKTLISNINGMYDFRTATEADAPTGNWLAKVLVGGSSFTKTVKIETVKPNHLKINIDFGTDILKNSSAKGTLNAKWLHGAVGRNLRADIAMDLRSTASRFNGFQDFVFDDPSKSYESEEKEVFEGKLDSLGNAVFSPSIRVGNEAPGMLQVLFNTRVYENSGDFSVDRFPVLYSPYSRYVGVKIPKGQGWNGALYSNEPNLIPIVTVDPSGNPVDIKDLIIEIYDVRWRWWWDRDEYDDLASYVRNKSRNLIKQDRISTVNGKAVYELKFDKNLWGRKLIRITDPTGGHSTGSTFYLDYKGYWDTASQDGPGGAEMLSFTTNKAEYNVGEQIEVSIPEIKEGRALVSLETGSRIIEAFWVEAPVIEPLKIKASPAMAPNVFINISVLQPHRNTTNDRPIRLYGIQAVKVVDPNTVLHPVINMPDILEPEGKVEIRISEKDQREMTYTVAVVDEGLLDLTRFRTPELWEQFYSKEALGIRTWDLYKYVLGTLKGELAGLLSVGGDEFIKQDGKNNQNRFKPVVRFFGPFELKAGKSRSHTFTMPNYVGSVRTMVVAGYNGAYGSAEKATQVKKPLMVLATLPRMVSPSETVALPVTVFSMDPKVKKVTVEVKTNSLFTLEGFTSKSITFDREGDQVVNFMLHVAKKIGAGQVEVIAQSGNQQATDKVDLQVRLPNPRISRTVNEMVEPGQSWNTVYQAIGTEGTNNGLLELSVVPQMNLEQRLKFLMDYPHGCVEQTTSAVFPQLYLHNFMELRQEQMRQIQENVTEGINRLKTFQLSNGGLMYWPGIHSTVSEWGTSYAGHFMLEAEAQGYQLPIGFLSNWIKYQTRMANSWDRESGQFVLRRSNEINQAYRLYTLALAKKPAIGAMNRMREIPELSVTAKWNLAGAYLLTGQKEVAQQLIARLPTKVDPYRELSYTYGSSERDQAIILDVITRMGDMITAKKIVEELAQNMSSGNWYSTQTTAFILMSMGKFIGGSGSSGGLDLEIDVNGKSQKISTNAPLASIILPFAGNQNGTIRLKNTMDRRLFINVQLDGIPLEGEVKNESSDLLMSVHYFDMNGKVIDPYSLEQGSDIIAEVKLTHPGIREDYKELALTQLFPSGWEIRNLRMDIVGSSRVKDIPDYQDIRDDRVYSYFGLKKNESKTFIVLLNTTYLGEFYLPAVHCEAMYDHSIHATSAGGRVRVVQQK